MVAVSMLNFPDTASCGKAIEFINIVIPHLSDQFTALIAGETLHKAIRALMTFKEEMHLALTGLITTIYVKYVEKSQLPHRIFSQIPNITEQRIIQLDNELKKATSMKRHRKLMSKFLKNIAGVML